MQKGCNVFWKSKHWKSLIEVSEATLHNHTIIQVLFEWLEEWPFSLNQWALKFPVRALEMSHLKGKLLLGFFQRETFADGSPGHAMNALHIVAWCLCHSSSPVEVEHGWTKHSSLPSSKARGLQICLQTSFQFILQDISNAFSCSFCLAPKTQHYRITSCSVPVPTSTLQPSAAPCRPQPQLQLLVQVRILRAPRGPRHPICACWPCGTAAICACACCSFHHPIKCILTSWCV